MRTDERRDGPDDRDADGRASLMVGLSPRRRPRFLPELSNESRSRPITVRSGYPCILT